MKENIKISKSKKEITRETFLQKGQVLWGKTDSKEGHNHYKLIFDIIENENDRTINVIGITKNPQDEFLKINPKDFCGETKIDGWLDVEYLNKFSYQEFLALPELYLEQKVVADEDLIVNINRMLDRLYELKNELLKTQQQLKQTKQILEIEREESETNILIGGALVALTAIGAFFLGQNTEQNKNKDDWH